MTAFVVAVKAVEVLEAVRTWVSGTKIVETTTVVSFMKVLQKELASTDRVLSNISNIFAH